MDTAVLIDGAFLRKKFHAAYKKNLEVENIKIFSEKVLEVFNIKKSDLHRFYFYDCEPCVAKSYLPISNHAFLFEKTPQYAYGKNCFPNWKKCNYDAISNTVLVF